MMSSSPTYRYIWNISDAILLHKIKSAKSRQYFQSPIFTAFGLKWFIMLFPNGTKSQDSNVNIYLYLSDLPPSIHKIELHRTQLFVQGNKCYTSLNSISNDKMYCHGWPTQTLTTAEISKYHELTFKVDFKLQHIFDTNGNDIISEYCAIISHDKARTHMQKRVQMENDSSNINLNLNVSAAKLDAIMLKLDQLNMRINKMEKTINDIQLKLNEDDEKSKQRARSKLNINSDSSIDKNVVYKDSRMDLMEQQIKSLQQSMDRYHHQNPQNIHNHENLKSWLKNKVQLPQYFDVFISNGIEDLQTASLLTMNAIKSIGIDKIGHQMKILNQVIELKENEVHLNNNNWQMSHHHNEGQSGMGM